MSRTRKRGNRLCRALPVRSLVFLWTWTRESVVPYELGINQPENGSRRQENGHSILKKLHIQNFYGAEPFLKRDLKSKKGKETTYFLSTTQTKTIIIRTVFACNQLCIYAECVCVWFDQNNQNKEARHREVPELFGRRSHEFDATAKT